MYWENIRTEEAWNVISEISTRDNYVINCCINKCKHPVVYFDMDGVLAKFDKHATMEEVFSPGYFRHLPPIKENILLVKALMQRGYDVRILSKSVHHAIQEKREWLQEYLPELKDEDIFFVPLDADKTKFVQQDMKNLILVDDYNPNLEDWRKHGGYAIKCVTPINNENPAYDCYNISDGRANIEKFIGFIHKLQKQLDSRTSGIQSYGVKRAADTELDL